MRFIVVGALLVLAVSCGGGGTAPATPPAATAPSPAPPPIAPPAPVLQARVLVISVPSPYSGTYTGGEWIRLIAELAEPVRVEGSPRLAIEIGDAIRHADFSPWVAHRISDPEHKARSQVKRGFELLPRFDYLVRAVDLDQDGFSIGVDAFDFTEGALLNEAGQEVKVEIYSVTPTESEDESMEPGSDLVSHPVIGMPRPRVCTDELERARGRTTALVDEWNGTPFVFYFNLAGTPDSLRAEADRVLEAAGRLSERIEDQIGYSIFSVGGSFEDARIGNVLDGNCSDDGRKRGQIVAMYQEDGPARANRLCGTWVGDLNFGNGTVSHELFHLFGFEHHPEDWIRPGQYERGVFMSRRLTGVYVDERDTPLSFEDADALRCIFPDGV